MLFRLDLRITRWCTVRAPQRSLLISTWVRQSIQRSQMLAITVSSTLVTVEVCTVRRQNFTTFISRTNRKITRDSWRPLWHKTNNRSYGWWRTVETLQQEDYQLIIVLVRQILWPTTRERSLKCNRPTHSTDSTRSLNKPSHLSDSSTIAIFRPSLPQIGARLVHCLTIKTTIEARF